MSDLAEATMRRYLRPDGPLVYVMEQFFHPDSFHAMTPAADRQPDEWQRDFLLAFGAQDAAGKAKFRRMAAVACKGPGKTAALAWIGLYFVSTRPHSKVACTSITGANLDDCLWPEFPKWMKRSPFLMAKFVVRGESIEAIESPETWFISRRTWKEDTDPQQQANSLAGLHADYAMWLIDEVSDIPDGVVQAAEGVLNSGIETRIVICGNPTRTEGPLWRACKVEAHLWFVIYITGDPDDPKRSPRIDIDIAREKIAKHGREDYLVMVNILGQFPKRQADKLLDIQDCLVAAQRELEERAYHREAKVLGADVGRFGGDASVIAPRQGRVLFRLKDFHGLDGPEFGEQIIKFANTWGADGGFFDGGGVGASVEDFMKRSTHAGTVRPINFGSAALEPHKYLNRRAEMYVKAKEWVLSGGCLPDDPLLHAELAAPKFWYDNKQRVCLEPKDDIKARLGRSPDRADAFVLTFAGPVRPRTQYVGVGARREAIPAHLVPSNHVTDN